MNIKLTIQSASCIKRNGAKPPTERVSAFRNKFAGSTEDQWKIVEGAGWLHFSEIGILGRDYIKSCESGLYINANVSIRLVCFAGSSINRLFISQEEANDPNGKYIYDTYMGYAYSKADAVEIFQGDAVTKLVISKAGVREYCKQCSITKKVMHKDYLVRVEPNPDNITYVWRELVNTDQSNVFRCSCCDGYYVGDQIKRNHGIPRYAGLFLCETCYNSKKNQGVILPHNYTCVYAPVYTRVFNRLMGGEQEKPTYRLFGVEVETEFSRHYLDQKNINRFDMARAILEVMPKNFVIIKEDGSLVLNGKYTGAAEFDPENKLNGKVNAGFEIVSAPADLHAHRVAWAKLETMPHFGAMRAWDTNTCGLHIHVSREAMGNLQIGRILAFINHPLNRPFIRRMAGRSDNKYSILKNKHISDSLRPEQGERDERRRVAVNVQNVNTIEFRIFRGTVRPAHIIRNIEFVDALCDYCGPGVHSFYDLFNIQKFIGFVCNDVKSWPFLASWMISSGMAIANDGSSVAKKAKAIAGLIEPDIEQGPLPKLTTSWDAIGLRSHKEVAF